MRLGTLMLLVVIVALALGLVERQRQLERFSRACAQLLEIQSAERAEHNDLVRRLEWAQTRLAAYKRREKFDRSVAGLPAEGAAVARRRFEQAERDFAARWGIPAP